MRAEQNPGSAGVSRTPETEKTRAMADATSIEGIHPLAPMQEGMWFHALYTPEHDVYVEQVSCLIEGQLDVVAFRRAWNEVVARHSALRTSFHAVDDGHPVQLVHRTVEVPWTLEDWRELSAETQQDLEAAFLRDDRARGFDPAEPPLIRFALLRVGATAFRFVWTHHHLLLDGWSVPLVLGEVEHCYAALRDGRPQTLPAVRPYTDYVRWLERQDHAAAEKFWQTTLKGFHTPTALPLDRGTSQATVTPEYLARRTALSAEVTAGLQAAARRYGITLSTAIQGAWALLLSRYSGRQDVVYGMTVAGRPPELPGVEGMVGLFINSLPVRVEVESDRPAGEWLRALQNRLLELRSYEYTQLARVQSWSEVTPGAPLFESLVVVENFPVQQGDAQAGFAGLRIVPTRTEEWTNYPVTLLALPGHELGLHLLTDPRRLAADDATGLLEQLVHLLTALAATPETPVGLLPLMAPEDGRRLAARWNATATDYPRDLALYEQFQAQTALRPDAVALVHGARQYSYARLAARAMRIATALNAQGLAPTARIGVFLPRSVALVEATLGILAAGGVYVPLDPDYPAERLFFMMADSRLDAVLTDDTHRAGLPQPGEGVHVLSVDELPDRNAAADGVPTPLAGGEQLAYLMYTSGSTGTPKGIAVPHRAVTRLVRNTDYVDPAPGDRIAFASNTAFDASTFELWGALLNGATVVIVDKADLIAPADYSAAIRRHALTTVFMTTAVFRQIATILPAVLAPLHQVMTGGEHMDPAAMATVLREGPPTRLVHIYGPTESTTFALSHLVRNVPAEASTVPIGRPLANTTAYVLDPAGRPTPPGAVGELFLGGDGLAHGYWDRPALTAERFLPDPFSTTPGARLYRTGDLVRGAADGTVTFLGRTDRQVKVRGFRIEPGEIEEVLRACPGVRAAVVRLMEPTPGDKRLVAYVAADTGALTAHQLRDFCADRLPGHMVPAGFIVLDRLPLTPNGKTDLSALPDPEQLADADRDTPYRAPQGAVESMLADIWQDILGVERIGADDDFFALGGHSLLAARIQNRLRAVFDVELPLRSIFTESTLASLAAAVEAARTGTGGAPVPLLRPRDGAEPVPLSSAQQRLWFLERWEPGTSLYHITGAVRLRGDLLVSGIRTGWQRLVDRHETLRTHIDQSVPDGPLQVVRPSLDGRPQFVDLSGLPEPAREAAVTRLVHQVTESPFDLTTGPLWRVALLRLTRTEHVLAISLHHLIADGRSLEVLLAELGVLYRAALTGTREQLAPLPVQFADYVCWQRSWLAGERLDRGIAHWKRTLAGAPALSLPTDRARDAGMSADAALETVQLSASADAKLQAISREVAVTPFMALLAVFAVALGQNRDIGEVVVGTPVEGRGRTELEGLIGFFANTLVLRLDLSGDPTFRELLGRVRSVCLDAYAHQDVPFERVVQEVRPERSDHHLPLFQTWFVVQEAPPVAETFAGVEAEPVRHGDQQARYDLRLDVQRIGDTLRAVFEYKTGLFESASISRLARRFGRLLEVAAVEPDAPLSALTRQVGEAEDRTRRERRGSVSLASLNRLKNARREVAREADGPETAQGENA